MRHLNFSLFRLCLLIPLLQSPLAVAQQSKQVPPAPIPATLLAAKTAFISNGGGEEWPENNSPYTGGPNRAYNQFYAGMKSWGRFALVDSPTSADLLFEIRFSLPPAERTVFQGDTIGNGPFDPQFRLEIRDSRTHTLLWGLTEHAHWAILQGNRDKNFDEALQKLFAELQALIVLPASASGAAK